MANRGRGTDSQIGASFQIWYARRAMRARPRFWTTAARMYTGPEQASGLFRRSAIQSSATASATSIACSSGFTFSNTFATLPSRPMMNVVRITPMYFRP
jgi:hypothetical protein